MKHFTRIILALLLIASLVGATDALQLTQPWNEGTVTSGAEISNSGTFQSLDQRVLNVNFNAAIDSSILGTHQASIGVIKENLAPVGVIELKKLSTASLATLYGKAAIDITQPFRIKSAINNKDIVAAGLHVSITGFTTEPPANNLGNRQVFTLRRSATALDVSYRNAGGTAQYWNNGGSVWQAGVTSVTVVEDKWFFHYIISDGTQWKQRLEDSDGSLITETDYILWSNTQALVGGGSPEDAYLLYQDNRTTAATHTMDLASTEIWPTELATTYLTAAQTVETDAYTFDETFNSEDVTFLVGSTPISNTTFKGYIQEDALAFSSAININSTTIAGELGWHALMPGTAFSSHSTVTIKAELNAPDSDTQLQILAIKIKGVTIAGGGADDKLIGGTLDGMF